MAVSKHVFFSATAIHESKSPTIYKLVVQYMTGKAHLLSKLRQAVKKMAA